MGLVEFHEMARQVVLAHDRALVGDVVDDLVRAQLIQPLFVVATHPDEICTGGICGEVVAQFPQDGFCIF